MDAVREQGAIVRPMLRAWRRKVAVTIVLLAGSTLLLCGSSGWSSHSAMHWAIGSGKVDQNISIPFTDWQLEMHLRLHRAKPPRLSSVLQLFDVFPMRSKLYSIGLLCTPRLGLLWAWLFDYNNTVGLFHEEMQRQQHDMGAALRQLLPSVVPPGMLESASVSKAVQDLQEQLQLVSPKAWYWLAWLVCPGLQVACYSLLFVNMSRVKVVYAVVIGLARSFVELTSLLRLLATLLRGNRQQARQALLCCYGLPLIMTFQSLSVLTWMCLCLPSWVVHISMVAFCIWGPPVMIALQSTAWQQDNGPEVPDAGQRAWLPGGVEGIRVAELGLEAVDRLRQLQQPWPRPQQPQPAARNGGGLQGWSWNGISGLQPHWPPPLLIPKDVEELDEQIPRSFLCPITHAMMREPAVTNSGASYERAAIIEWLRSRRRDPLTGRDLRVSDLSPNLNLHSAIEDWVQQQLLLRAQRQAPSPIRRGCGVRPEPEADAA